MAATTPTGNVSGTVVNHGYPSPTGKKHPDSLFGPNIGIVSSGPAWTTNREKKVLADELTPDVVRGWIEKSKVASEPTTTLQALVNLKRPTLRLSPLASGEDTVPDNHHHGLEFEFDCDAPKCGIYVHVLLDANHPDAPAATSPNGLSKLLVFETVVEGGFGKVLKIEEGATLELGRFIYSEDDTETPRASPSIPPATASTTPDEADPSSDTVPTSTALPLPTETGNRQSRLRFSHFHFRKRTHNHSVSGPALAVVDAEPSTSHDGDSNGVKEEKKEDADDGVKGTELASPNEQLTYLHVVRFGAKPSAEEEDTRPWVVKVVKREATIGPHTFHLHEIYGLSSSSTTTHAPTAPLPDNHTYPPESATTPQQQQPVAEDEPSSECLLCLSSPREVILLPCRHLVACKECALNMVEFGAGGTITQTEEPVAAAAEEGAATTEGAGDADGTTSPAPAPTPTPTVIVNTRRKRKAKGWFCPVCRQPYTSLLRITNTPPEPESTTKEQGINENENIAESTAMASASTPRTSGGLLSGALRPAFLRSFSRNPAGDVESQTQMTQVGA
ncbi:uncharacterized protein BT62DRAFT_982873 [Guyanagaster necrorhizus]|uniref:RING-type domain-containing protein n=1 Tax=Guyanagaster necrorhizus TaxID=856835 RepID=A0A9P7VIQ5_9AGAR|nr:uncharacterized protein BT62DRAFT_982873 [Guyanagaster necrorhizus MCA 3950]KAG7441090.1 hypothetical protein BT62DRAFT_982873 [Guyanagaster necrorhizus MCA 3950]